MRKTILNSFFLLLISIAGTQASAQCNPAFSFTANGATVRFQAVTNAATASHSWHFGDNTYASDSAIVHHTYQQPGQYRVVHIVRDSSNGNFCVDSVSQLINVVFTPTCNASFSVRQDSLVYNRYTFTSQQSGSIASYVWTIDGQQASTSAWFTATLSNGSHTICLQTTTSAGCVANTCQQLNVTNPPPPCSWQASFTTAPAFSNPRLIYFNQTPIGQGYVSQWSFGDGTSSQSSNPSHLYAVPGTYQVRLIVTQPAFQCRDTITKLVQVYGSPADSCTASFTYAPTQNQSNQISFTATSNQTISSQTWIISPVGDTTNSTYLQTSNPTHTFLATGNYLVCLNVITTTGCSRYYCDTITIASLGGRYANSIPSYPNPARNEVMLQLNLEQAAPVTIRIFNSYGIAVHSSRTAGNAGINRVTIPVQSLGTGQYYIEIEYNGQRKRSLFNKL
ncbi:MAG TPA: PKD domain-containing protein [Flavisolibacter sp.]|nr:PKD domain-containing protein [Flavisolibacter sp.]